MLPNSHDEANMTLKSKPNEDITIKLEINTLINIHVKILNKKKNNIKLNLSTYIKNNTP